MEECMLKGIFQSPNSRAENNKTKLPVNCLRITQGNLTILM